MLSLIVPCFNEEGNVRKFFDEVNKAFEGKVDDYEFVFVDDGSRDKTYPILKELYETQKDYKIQVLSFSRNFGKESAIFAGLSNAKGDMACLIDADLQQRPQVVLEMLDVLNSDEEIDCVTAYQDERIESKMMTSVKSAFYKVINKVSDVDFVNGASDFRLMKRNMIDALLEMTEYHRFSKGLFSWVGFKTAYIPYEVAERESGESKWGFKKLMKYALEGIMAFTTMPLRIPTYLGVLSGVAAIIYLLAVIICKYALKRVIPACSPMVVLLLVMSALVLISIGIVGEYLSKIYLQVKNRPVYILKRHLDD